jgi:hypothetical protein
MIVFPEFFIALWWNTRMVSRIAEVPRWAIRHGFAAWWDPWA